MDVLYLRALAGSGPAAQSVGRREPATSVRGTYWEVPMSRGVYRGIYSALPDDPDFQQLSPDARLVLLVARICQQAGPAAIFRYYPELLRAQTGLSAHRLEAAFAQLEVGNWLYRDGPVLWIRNALRHDPTTTLANENHKKSVIFWLKGLPKCGLVLRFCDYYSLPYPFEAPSNGHPMGSRSKEIDSEKDSEKEKDKENYIVGLAPDVPPRNSYRAQAREILDFLNLKAGSAFEPVEANLKLIEARLKEGASVEACRGVIVRKVRKWATDPKMAEYLRPATLFNATKFAQYVGEQGRPS